MRAAQQSITSSSTSISSSSSPKLLRLSLIDCQRKWPFLKPRVGCDKAVYDPSGGIIDPHGFIQAQNHGAARTKLQSSPHHPRCLEIRSDVAIKIRSGGVVELASGEILRASEKVVLCGGAFSNALLNENGIGTSNSNGNKGTLNKRLRASKRTVALLEVSLEIVQGMLRDMPTIKYAFGLDHSSDDTDDDDADAVNDNANNNDNNNNSNPAGIGGSNSGQDQNKIEAGSVYILPPVYYPERDGKWFVKIGGGPNDFEGINSKAEIENWLSSQGDPSCVTWLEGLLRSLLPGVPFGSVEGMACVTTVESTSTSKPQSPPVSAKGIGVVVDDLLLADKSIVMISACQGKGAGPADAIGREVAQRITTLTKSPGD